MKVYKDFINQKEIDDLCYWIDSNKQNFEDANMGGNRITSRFINNMQYPPVAYTIKDRIEKKLNIKNFNYMAASCAYPGDHCYLHKDSKKQNYDTFHCNLFLSDIEGGQAYIQKTPTEEDIIPFTKGNMLCYYVSKVYHGSKILKKGERKMWVYSFSIKDA
tara:strand:- start:1110 stop:1592 length:483 start_codon:yes stop_codon:yes gene_type:complete